MNTAVDVVEQLSSIGRRLLQLEDRLTGQPAVNGALATVQTLWVDPLATLAVTLAPLVAWPGSLPAETQADSSVFLAARTPGIMPGGETTPRSSQPGMRRGDDLRSRGDDLRPGRVARMTAPVAARNLSPPDWAQPAAVGQPEMVPSEPAAENRPLAGRLASEQAVPRLRPSVPVVRKVNGEEARDQPTGMRLVRDSVNLRSLLQANLDEAARATPSPISFASPQPATRSLSELGSPPGVEAPGGASGPSLAADSATLRVHKPPHLPRPRLVTRPGPYELTADDSTQLYGDGPALLPADLPTWLLNALAEELELAYLRMFGTSGV